MRITSLPVLMLIMFGQLHAQTPQVEQGIALLENTLTENKPAPQVLILGSFHFGYYNLDAHKTAEDDQVDVLDKQRQKELDSLVELISAFQPTKIAVESGPITGYLMYRYRDWIKGKEKLKRSEIDQIGFRLMRKFQLDTIYGINAVPFLFDIWDHRDSSVLHPIFDSIYADWDFKAEDSISLRYARYYDLDDSLAAHMPLYDYFALMNDDRMLDRGYGAYLNGDFTLGDSRGPLGVTPRRCSSARIAARERSPIMPSMAPTSWPRCASRVCSSRRSARDSPGSSVGQRATNGPAPRSRSDRCAIASA